MKGEHLKQTQNPFLLRNKDMKEKEIVKAKLLLLYSEEQAKNILKLLYA